MKKVITIVGARPQFIKAACLSRQFRLLGIDEMIVHTGQHFDNNMSDIFFEEMEIPKPAFQLNIHELTHGAMTGRMLEGIEKILLNETPDGVIVYGDTNSTLAGALAASKLHIPVIHVEAGLRSFNAQMPEEINRILTDQISSLLFCPTEIAVNNLKHEGFENMPVQIFRSGDIMFDAALFYTAKANEKSNILNKIPSSKFVLATIHRSENTDSPEKLRDIIEGLNEINRKIPVVLPIHPRTRNVLSQLKIQPDFKIIDPVGYLEMIMLLKSCELVVTDSGGLQKEAFFFRKQCITLREQTEWVELVDNGFNVLVGSDKQKLLLAFDEANHKLPDFSLNLYGNGTTSQFIAKTILKA